MRIHFLTRYGSLAPSSRLRSYQFAEPLRALGHQCFYYPFVEDDYVRALYARERRPYLAVASAYLDRAWELRSIIEGCDVAVVEKELFPWLPASVSRALLADCKTPVLVDYDDAVYASYLTWPLAPSKIDAVMSSAFGVIAGNHTIERYARHQNERVFYLPTVVDTQKYTPVEHHDTVDQLVIGWIGTPVTQSLLQPLGAVLRRFGDRRHMKLYAVGASRDFRIPGVDISVIPWSEQTETAELRQMHVGIMPLEDNIWNRGKCGYKLVQYMAAGLPTIASPVGANRDIVTHGVTGFHAEGEAEWISALERLLAEPSLRASMGRAGRRRVEEEFSLAVAAPRFAEILASAAEARGRRPAQPRTAQPPPTTYDAHPSVALHDAPPREEIACPVCGERDRSPLYRKNGFDVVRCSGCALVYVNPQPSDAELMALYRLWGEQYFSDERQVASDFSPVKYEAELGVLLERTGGRRGTLLDVGCATGSFLRAARERGFDVKGIDLSEPSVKLARERFGLDVVQGDFAGGLFPAESFDVVTMWASVEHLRRPMAYLREARRVLRRGGKLFVSVPNSAGIASRVLGKRYRYVCIEHLSYFTPGTLENALALAGFGQVETATRKFNPVVIRDDLRGFQNAPESQIQHNQNMQELKTAPRYRALRQAHRLVTGALSRLDLADLLFGVASL
jgi:glycosyltransferase involved in cell wall biosynthesis/2-polyprenyl-3-methyl-5-hydroxy-6-metoxy-1,4-benzoquinol methylase